MTDINRTKDELDENATSENQEAIKEQADAVVPDEEARSAEDTCDKELEDIKKKLEEKTKQCDEYLSMLQRTAAEFDNYKKRTAKEKEALYSDASADVVTAFLPIVDNFERAVQAFEKNEESKSLKEGVELVFRQLKEVMKKLGVEEIKTEGQTFDPELHNAVMHIDDESYGENVIVEEFQKGYLLKDRVIRHSMVKVAN